MPVLCYISFWRAPAEGVPAGRRSFLAKIQGRAVGAMQRPLSGVVLFSHLPVSLQSIFRGSHLSNTASLTQALFKSDESCNKFN